MAKVIIHTTMTLDGFIARPNDRIDWAFKYAPDEMINEIMAEIGAVVMGNRDYISEDALPYGGQVKVPQFGVTFPSSSNSLKHHPVTGIFTAGRAMTSPSSILFGAR